MKGRQGVSMQGIEHAPKKKGNVLCRECEHLIFRTTGNSKTKDVKCNHYCMKKNRPTWYTAQCYCKDYKPKEAIESRTPQVAINILQKRAEVTQTERIQKRLNRKRKGNKH